MDTHKKIREHISALVDNELARDNLELAMAALQTADGQQAWHTYHRIGDVLRAAPVPELSDGFGARLAERLAQEPAFGKRARAASPLKIVIRISFQGEPGKRSLNGGVRRRLVAGRRSKRAPTSRGGGSNR